MLGDRRGVEEVVNGRHRSAEVIILVGDEEQ
jgi:hypothetical protein